MRALPCICFALGALLTVPAISVAAPANDNFADAQTLSIGDKVNGTTIGATLEPNEPFDGTTQTIWYEITVSAKQRLVSWSCLNEAGAPTANTSVVVYRGTALGNLSHVAGGSYCVLSFPVDPGTYWLRVETHPHNEGNFTLNLWDVPRPANDDRADAEVLPAEMGLEVLGTTIGATPETGETWFSGESAYASVWYRWTAPQDRRVQVDTCGETAPALFVYELGAAGELFPRLSDIYGCDTEYAPYPPAILKVDAGKEYLISVDNDDPWAWWTEASDGEFGLYIDDAGPPPPTPVSGHPATPAHTGKRAAALRKCKKKPSAKRREKCRKKANRLPV